MRFEASVMINRPVEEVWNFMTNWSKFPKLNPAILEARQTSSGPAGVGTAVEARTRNLVTNIRVIGCEPNRKLTLEHTSGPLKGTRTSFSMEAIEGKTRLSLATDAELSGFYRLVGLFASGRMKSEVQTELANVRRWMESEGRP